MPYIHVNQYVGDSVDQRGGEVAEGEVMVKDSELSRVKGEARDVANEFHRYVITHGPKGEDLPLAWIASKQKGIAKHQVGREEEDELHIIYLGGLNLY